MRRTTSTPADDSRRKIRRGIEDHHPVAQDGGRGRVGDERQGVQTGTRRVAEVEKEMYQAAEKLEFERGGAAWRGRAAASLTGDHDAGAAGVAEGESAPS